MKGIISGILANVWEYGVIKLNIHLLTYLDNSLAIFLKESTNHSQDILLVLSKGSNLHKTFSLPTILLNSFKVFILSSTDGTFGSMSVPYGVIVYTLILGIDFLNIW